MPSFALLKTVTVQILTRSPDLASPTDFKGLNQHELYLNSSCNCQVQAEALSPRSSQLYTNQYDLSRSDCSLGKHTHHKVYHIRSQHLDLFLGVLSISILRKKNTRSDLNSRQQNSYTDIRLKFTPSFSFSRSFVARLYANTVAGLSVMQSLVTVQIVPRYEGIFLDVCGGDVTSAKRRLYNKEALPDSTDKYGHSLIAMVRIFKSR